MGVPTPHKELEYAITTWEGLFQDQEQDAANWVHGRLVGTMRGVTPAVLAAHRGIPVTSVTKDMMKTVTLTEAVEIGVTRFYKGTGLDLLPWGPATAALVDVGWGSGPRQAILFAQRLAGSTDDGRVGPETIAAYSNWVAKVGWEEATRGVHKLRAAFYDLIIRRNPQWEMYRRGWNRRADSMLPGTLWWGMWADNMPGLPTRVVMIGQPDELPVTQAPAPASKSRTLKAAATAVAGGAATMADKATDGVIAETLSTTTSKVAGYAAIGGAVMWLAIGLTIAGAGYAIWRIIQDRKAPA